MSEYFYAIELTKDSDTKVWDPESDSKSDAQDGNVDRYPKNHKLILKSALLGHNAATDEFNVVEVETMTITDSVKIPIVVLKSGELRQTKLDLEFADAPVTFKLIKGAGPVYIHGNHLEEEFEEFADDMEEGEDEELEDEEEDLDEEEVEGNPKKKMKLSHNPTNKNGKASPGKPTTNIKKK